MTNKVSVMFRYFLFTNKLQLFLSLDILIEYNIFLDMTILHEYEYWNLTSILLK